ncbi:MAG: MgtC/SapB family protein [Chlorobiales bacterium]|nr:MgtC/SapB family protein [Chlorobiales bacterium]
MLIGIERGWRERKGEESVHMAGVRTFGLIGMLGALWAMLAENMGPLLLGLAFVAFAALMIVAHVLAVKRDMDYGLTTVVASLITFALGALAMRGYETVSAAVAVVTTTILGIKPILHGWVERLEQKELFAIFKLLLISVVILPALPDRGFGPWDALNPYEIWLMIVLIAAISFVGYFAMKVAGPKRGCCVAPDASARPSG